MVRYLDERAKREHLDNIVALQGSPDDPELPEKVELVQEHGFLPNQYFLVFERGR